MKGQINTPQAIAQFMVTKLFLNKNLRKGRQEILVTVNAPFETRKAIKIKAKNQELLLLLLYDMFDSGHVSKEDIGSLYQLLNSGNYPAWEDDFRQIHEKYQQDQNAHHLITSLNKLFDEYKIRTRETISPRQLNPEDLELVGCMFLVNSSFKEWSLLA